MALANRWVTTRQLGFLLGFMGTRVLGQYDLALLSAEATPGPAPVRRGEHPRRRRRALGVPLGAVPDLDRPPRDDPRLRVRGASRGSGRTSPTRLERQLTLFGSDARGARAARPCAALGRALRGEADGEHWMERLMGDEQRRLFRETQAVMSLLEGFSDYVMDEVGRDLVPGRRADQRAVPRAARRSGRRSSARCSGSPGMDLKMEQYKKGERVRARRSPTPAGRAALDAALGRARDAAARRRDRRARSAGSRACLDRLGGRTAVTERRGRARRARAAGPAACPTAIALSPILSARYRSRDLERIRAAAPGRPARHRLGRGPRRRPARRRRGPAPRLAAAGGVRPAPRPRAAPVLGPLGDVGRRAGADAGRAASAGSSSRTPAASSAGRSPSTC